jgi:DNA-binding PadR family transcriptional regulator
MRQNAEKFRNYILENFRRGEFYGYQLQKNLSENGFKIDITRLYKILNEMHKEELLTTRWVKSQEGPRKKMYKLSEKGKKELNNILLGAIHTVHSFYGDYLLSLQNTINVFEEIMKPINQKIINPQKLGFIFTSFNPLVNFYLAKIMDSFDCQFFYIIPRTLEIEKYFKNVVILNGEYRDIPLKNDHLDAIIMIDLPHEQYLKESVIEWSRVLKDGGVISILTPSILLKKEIDPMSIGDFVEKTEHHIIEKGEIIELSKLVDNLSPFFSDIKENSVVHISTITCQKKS